MGNQADSRTLLANERTFLAWLRTGVSLMAFGFVVSKFDLFVHMHRVHATGLRRLLSDTNLGLAAVACGVMVIGVAAVHYHRVRERIYRGDSLPRSGLPLAIAVLLGLLGLVVFFFLLPFH